MEEKKEEWKELLEQATLEDKTEKKSSDEFAQVTKTTEPIKENIAEVAPVNNLEDFEEIDQAVIDKKAKREFRSRLVMVLVLGFLIGIALKTEALKRVTIGYNDYLMKSKSQSYNINQMQVDLAKAQDAANQAQTQTQPQDNGATAPTGGVPSIDGGGADSQTTKDTQTQN